MLVTLCSYGMELAVEIVNACVTLFCVIVKLNCSYNIHCRN
jgi:hypothetical protein